MVKRAILAETYVVVSMKFVMSMAALGVIEMGEGHPQVEEMDWHGTFVWIRGRLREGQGQRWKNVSRIWRVGW